MILGARELVQQIRGFIALEEVPGEVIRTHMVANKPL